MAEPVALLAKIPIKEEKLKSFLRKKSKVVDNHRNADVLASLLYNCKIESGNVFLFYFENDLLFTAYWINYYTPQDMQTFRKTLDMLCRDKEDDKTYAFLSDSSGLMLEANRCDAQGIVPIDKRYFEKYAIELEDYWKTFWSFSQRNDFPPPEKALRKRNYFYKPLKSAYKRYLKRIEEIEKPAKIKAATKDNPYILFGDFFTYDERVFYNDFFRKKIVEVPGADPYTFKGDRDKNHMYGIRIIGQKDIIHKVMGMKVNNPDTRLEFFIMEDIDPLTFTYIKERWDTIYWKDKNHVYILKEFPGKEIHYHKYVKVPEADLKSFEYLNFAYGKDKNHLYYFDRILPIKPSNYRLNEYGFIYDDTYIYHYGTSLNLDPKSFQVVSYEDHVNLFAGPFELKDKNGRCTYNPKDKKLTKM